MKEAVWKSSLTTVFGVLGGLPVIVLGVFVPGTPMALSPYLSRILLIIGGIGIVGTGVVAKAFNVHSTAAQVETSTAVAAQQAKPN